MKETLSELQELRRLESLQRECNRVLELLARGEPLQSVLEALALGVESVVPELLCCVLLLDADSGTLRTGSAPSLPAFYNEAVDGLPIGPQVGSCGAAAFSGQRIVAEDVMTHPNWVGYRELARRAGLRACWSEPVRTPAGVVLGTFAMYYRVPRGPMPFELEIIQHSAHIAGIAIEHAKAKDALRASEERFRQVTESIREVFWLTDWDQQKVLYVSPAYEEIWGRTRQSLLDDPRSWAYDIHPEDRKRAMNAFKGAGEGRYEVEYRLLRADGSVRWIFDRAFPIRDASGRVYRVAGLSEDVTQRKQTEEALRQANVKLDAMANQKLKTLTSELLLAEERERRKLAIDLHDSLNQTLVLARMKVADLRNSLSGEEARALGELQGLLDQANRSVRSATFQLSPPILHDLGFEPAVEWLVEDIRQSYGLHIQLETTGEDLALEDRVKVLLYRAVRELLINVAKHAHAESAVVRIVLDVPAIRISVEDDGTAFDPEARGTRGLGLGSIGERLTNLGGSMRIDSSPGNGTRISLVAPLVQEQQEEPGG